MRRLVLVLVACALIVPAAACAWTWPVDGPVLHPFVFDPAHPYASGQHRGLDIAAPEGADVRAPAPGTVTFAGTVPNGGKTVTIETSLGYNATLLHLGTLKVARGASVDEGNVVATAGADGYVYFGLRTTGEAQGYVDPQSFLPSRDVPTTASTPAPADAATAPAETAPAAPPPASVATPVDVPAVTAADPVAPAVASPKTQPDVAAPEVAPAATPRALPVATSEVAKGEVPPAAKPATDINGSADETTVASPAEPAIAASGLVPVGIDVMPPSVLAPAGLAAAPHAGDVFGADALASRASVAAAAGAPGDRAYDGRSRGRSKTAASDAPRDAASTAVITDHLSEPANGSMPWAAVGSSLALVGAIALAAIRLRRRGRRTPPRIIGSGDGDAAQEDPGCTGVAVRERTAASRSRGGLRGPGRHLRALPPLEGQRRDDGERYRRARDAGDGRGRPRGRVAA